MNTRPSDEQTPLLPDRLKMPVDEVVGDLSAPVPTAAPDIAADAVVPLIRPIDLDALLRRCQGKTSLVEKLLMSFERQIGKQLALMRAELERRDLQTLAQSARTIMGAAVKLSAEPIRASAAELEARILANDPDAAAGCFEALAAHVRECVAYLPAAIEQTHRSTDNPS